MTNHCEMKAPAAFAGDQVTPPTNDGAEVVRYRLEAGEGLWDLLLVMTLNLLRSEEMFHRAHKRDVRQTVGWGDTATGPERAAGADALQALAVDEAIRRLPEEQREVVRLRMDGYEVAEIASRTDRSKRTVERILKESRTRLRSLLHLEF